MEYLEMVRSYSPDTPKILIGAGLALLIVPKWIRMIIALGLIFVGVTEMYPELLSGQVPVKAN